jgi:hypothetical protein
LTMSLGSRAPVFPSVVICPDTWLPFCKLPWSVKL